MSTAMAAMDSSSNQSAPEPERGSGVVEHGNPVPRSSFLHLLTALLSAVIVGVPSTIGTLFFLDPLLRRRRPNAAAGRESRKDDAGFIRLAVTPDSIPDNGTPVLVTVIDDLEDAWNFFRDQAVGTIWLRKDTEGQIIAFNSVCPHLGCSVKYRSSDNDFFCPCHTSAFSLDGRKANEVPPRDMDSLQVARRTGGADDPKGEEVWVRFQNFRKASPEKISL